MRLKATKKALAVLEAMADVADDLIPLIDNVIDDALIDEIQFDVSLLLGRAKRLKSNGIDMVPDDFYQDIMDLGFRLQGLRGCIISVRLLKALKL